MEYQESTFFTDKVAKQTNAANFAPLIHEVQTNSRIAHHRYH